MRLVDLFINVAIKGHTRRCVRADVAYLDLNKQNAKVVPLVVVRHRLELERGGREKKKCMTSCIKLSDWNQASFIIIKNKPDTNPDIRAEKVRSLLPSRRLSFCCAFI